MTSRIAVAHVEAPFSSSPREWCGRRSVIAPECRYGRGCGAEAVLADATEAYRAALGDRLLAAYARGSLAHGGFSALVSDVDLGLIVGDPLRSGDEQTIAAIAEKERAKGSALHGRLSVFWGTPSTLQGDRPGGRFPPAAGRWEQSLAAQGRLRQ